MIIDLSVVIPVYNEEKTILKILQRIKKQILRLIIMK